MFIFSFQELVDYLRQREIVTAAKDILERVHSICDRVIPFEDRGRHQEASVNVRVFLASELITRYSDRVFESTTELVTDLKHSAVDARRTFFEICKQLRDGVRASDLPRDLLSQFPRHLFKYLAAFKAWKIPDQETLIPRIRNALVALYAAERHIPANEESPALQQEFTTQITRLRTKLHQIGGADALEEFDRTRDSLIEAASTTVPSTDVEPRPQTSSTFGVEFNGCHMTNERLAHELMLDPDFIITENGAPVMASVDSPSSRIRKIFHASFWSNVEEELVANPTAYGRIQKVLHEVYLHARDTLPANPLSPITVAKVTEEMQAPARFFSGLYEVMSRLRAPMRMEETLAKWTPILGELNDLEANADTTGLATRASIIVKATRFLLDDVNRSRLDAANARLRLIQPVVRDHGVEYQRGKIQEKLMSGTISMRHTKAFVDGCCDLTTVDVLRGAVEDSGLLKAFFNRTIADFFFQDKETPETFRFDVDRISYAKKVLNRLCLASAITARIFAFAQNRGNPADQNDFMRNLIDRTVAFFKADLETTNNVSDYRTAVMGATDPEITYVEDFLTFAGECFTEAQGFRGRVRSIMASILASYFSTKELKYDSLMVLEMYQEVLAPVCDMLYRVVDVNFRVHCVMYKQYVQAFIDRQSGLWELEEQLAVTSISSPMEDFQVPQVVAPLLSPIPSILVQPLSTFPVFRPEQLRTEYFPSFPGPVPLHFSHPNPPIAYHPSFAEGSVPLLPFLPPMQVALPIASFALPVEEGTMHLDFFAHDTARDRFLKANVGLVHATPFTPTYHALVDILNAAINEGGAGYTPPRIAAY